MHLGRHIIVDMFNVNNEKLNNINANNECLAQWDSYVKQCFVDANITLLETSWHNFDKKGAFTVVYLLAESHLSIHTWPEHNYIALDVFTCGSSDTQLVVDKIVKYFEPKKIDTKKMNRGEILTKNSNSFYDKEVLLY